MKIFVVVLLILEMGLCSAQKQGNIWYFTNYSGLDFTSGTPIALTNGQIHEHSVNHSNNSEGCSSICDSAGHLLFYADPTEIYNRNHQIMPNGNNLMGGLSSTQGVIIIPQPGSNNLFYVFTQDDFQDSLRNGLRYNIVDMCLDHTLGDVIPGYKNILLLDSVGEKLTATFHSNGTDIWLVTRKHFTNEFYSYLITAGGILAPVISSIGWINPSNSFANSIGQMKISSDGSKLAFAIENGPTIVQLFDFNNSTGVISNLIDISTNNSSFAYGVEFSPDNSKLYIQGINPGLVQFDITSGNSALINNSRISITSVNGGNIIFTRGLQLANDGKIYCAQQTNVSVINYPNLSGNACTYTNNVIITNAVSTLPVFISNFQYKNAIPVCAIDEVEYPLNKPGISVFPNPASNILTISSSLQFASCIFKIINLTGKDLIVHTLSGINIKETMDVSDISNGIYIWEVISSGGILEKGKMIIMR